jgi:hypothetical protein
MGKKQKRNKFLEIGFSLGIILFLIITFIFFSLNLITTHLKWGELDDFLPQVLKEERVFSPRDFGHSLGRIISDPDYYGREVSIASTADFHQAELNYLNLGPGVFLLPGKYSLTYDVAITKLDIDEDFAVIDVFSLSSGAVTQKTLNSSQFDQGIFRNDSFEFETEGGSPFEFRTLYLGQGELRVGNVILKRQSINYGVLLKKSFNLAWKLY